MYPKSTPSAFIEELGDHYVKCEKNKYGATMCFGKHEIQGEQKTLSDGLPYFPEQPAEYWTQLPAPPANNTANADPLTAVNSFKECFTYQPSNHELIVTYLRELTLTDADMDSVAQFSSMRGSQLTKFTFIVGLCTNANCFID